MLRSRRLGLLTALGLVAAPLTALPAAADHSPVFISEVHYDNDGTDSGEAIEVTAPVGTDLTGWSIELYNSGNGSVSYDVRELAEVVGSSGVIVANYPSNGIQNGDADGVALINAADEVVEFLSYEGTLTAADGQAAGVTSTDIRASEPGSTPVGFSLQRDPADHGTWSTPAENTFGVANDGSGPPPGGTVFISEIHYDNDGTDTGEAVEVQAAEGTDLTGWSVVLYNGNGGATYGTLDLPAGPVGTAGVVVVEGVLQNGSPDGLALVDAGGAVVEFLSYEGTIDAVGGPADGTTSVDIGLEEGSEPPGQSLQKIDGVWTGPAPASFGEPNEAVDETPIGECGDEATPVSAVQGVGDTSPLTGQTVTVEAVVITVKNGLRGYYVQEETADHDEDTSTSEGVFVRTGSDDNSNVSVGQLVRVQGTVEEFSSSGSSQTQLTTPETLVCAGQTPPIKSTEVTFPLDAADNLERYEGMLVELPDTLVISEYFNYGRFGEVVIAKPRDGLDRLFTPTAVVEPGAPAQELAAEYQRRIITLDDSNSSQNPAQIPHPGNGQPFTAENSFRGGDTVTGVEGVIDNTFGLYRIQPTEYGEYEAVNPRPTSAPDVGGDVQVASFNVLNYFLTLDDDSGAICGPGQDQDCRGANTAEEFDRQRTKILAALSKLDADVVGLIEMENTTGVEPAADLVAGLNAQLGAGTYDYLDTGVIGTDAIRVGFLYKPGVVQPVGDFAVLDSSDDPRFVDTKNRPMLTQTFDQVAGGERFTVSVNHLKSKGSDCNDLGDPDTGDGQANCNGTRTLAAQAIADYLAEDPTGSDDPDQLVVGDLNSYDHEDPIDVLTEAGYTDLIKQVGGEHAYGYVFDGQAGYLDYGMSNESLTSQVTGAHEWHINADEPNILDYDTTFKPDPIDALYTPDAYRSSDHDAVLIGLDLGGAGAPTDCFGLEPTIVDEDGGVIFGTHGDDVILAGGDEDYIFALNGDDVVCAGDGNDVVFAGRGDDRVAAGDGNDVLFGGAGDDLLDGGPGDDLVFDFRGRNTIV